MADLIATDDVFTPDQRGAMARLAAAMIPASEDKGLPSGGEDRIVDRALALMGPVAGDVATLLAAVEDARDDELLALLEQAGPAAMLVGGSLIQGYYQDEVVLQVLGRPGGPPFPQGHETAPGDLSLLDPVRARGKIYRDV